MSNNLKKNFIKFNELWKELSSRHICITKDNDLNISGNIISTKDFNAMYMKNIISMLKALETTISPEFTPDKTLYTTLDILSTPALNGTQVPSAINNFYKKLNIALLSKDENTQKFNNDIAEYIKAQPDTPVFMLISMENNLKAPQNNMFSFKSFIPSSNSLMEKYGTTYNGDDILQLANYGFIESKLPITMLIYKSLYVQDENSTDYIKPISYKELLDFYSPEKNPGRMHSLLINGEIDKNFSDLHYELLDNITKKEKKDYIESLIDEAKQLASTPSEYSNDILAYSNYKIIPDEYLPRNITAEFLIKKFISKELPLSRIIQIYEADPKYFKAIETILIPSEIEKAHSNDELNDDALLYIPKKSRLSYLQNAKLSTIMYLFLHCDGISITELQMLLSKNNINESLDFYIDNGSHISRIKELYEHYLIDYICIKNLNNTGIISDSDMKKYELVIAKDKVYDDINNSTSIDITSTDITIPISTTGTFIDVPPEISDSTKKTNDPIIYHKNGTNKVGFFNEYRVLPLKPVNLVALIPPNPIKSTYLIPYEEMAYIMNNNSIPDTLLESSIFQEIRPSDKMHEDILKTIYQFEKSKKYLEKLGYSENLNFDEAIKIMTKEYIKIRTKGEN